MQVGEAGWRNEAFQEGPAGKMLVFFYTTTKKNNFQSAEQKRPVFVSKTHIKKIVPGDTKLVIDRPMRELDKEEFPVEWARFEQKQANIIPGTPLEMWDVLSDTQKAELKALNIFTIDQMANLPDSAGAQIMGFHDLRTKARAFIMAAKDSVMLDTVRAETDAKLKAQDEEMAKMREMIAELSAKKKPGRKAKVTEPA